MADPSTDREALDALLVRFGLTPALYGTAPGVTEVDGGGTEVTLTAHHGGMDGYHGFYVVFLFDADGGFTSAGVYE